jgi:hypothetical protein
MYTFLYIKVLQKYVCTVVWNAAQYFIMPQCMGKLTARTTLAHSFINTKKTI